VHSASRGEELLTCCCIPRYDAAQPARGTRATPYTGDELRSHQMTTEGPAPVFGAHARPVGADGAGGSIRFMIIHIVLSYALSSSESVASLPISFFSHFASPAIRLVHVEFVPVHRLVRHLNGFIFPSVGCLLRLCARQDTTRRMRAPLGPVYGGVKAVRLHAV
jgi:hypothetical protein